MRARVFVLICLIGGWACSQPVAPESPGVFSTVTSGFQHTCALLPDGAAYCWGRNSDGQLGATLSGSRYSLPQVVSTESRFAQIHAGIVHTCALTVDGVAYCWGSNFAGVLGNDAITHSNIPVRVQGGLNFKAIAVGQTHTCALTVTGTAYCWGENSWQQLGHDTTALRVRTPVAVVGGHTFTSLTAGGAFTCGIESDGAAYCWGFNATGTLGSGDTARAIGVPVAVAGDLKFKSIAGGLVHACGVTIDGALYCWGSSIWGVLGIGPSSGDYRTPQRVGGDRSYVTVSVGSNHTCALDVDGALACWGANMRGQLATSTPDRCVTGPGPNDFIRCALMPQSGAAGGRFFQSLSAGDQFTCAVTFDGAAFCWGKNDEGQIGNGRTEPMTASPARVPDPPPLPPPPP